MRGYNGFMEAWEDQLHQMQDQVADYAYDWNECLNMVAEAPETKDLHSFLGFLVPRLKRMQRQFNRVRYMVPDRIWYIHNYDYKVYSYMTKRYGEDKIVVTDSCISIADETLTDTDRELLRKHLTR